jgi:hypothetical protein
VCALAAWSGHADVIRAILGECRQWDADEAFSIAVAKGDAAVLLVVGNREFRWTRLVTGLLELLPEDATARVCSIYDVTVSAVSLFSQTLCGVIRVWTAIKSMLSRGRVPWDVREYVIPRLSRIVESRTWMADEAFWRSVRLLNLDVGRMFPSDSYRMPDQDALLRLLIRRA